MTRVFDLITHLYRQRAWSEHTFGPGARTEGVCDHIRKELHEIAAAPHDLEEWVDVTILALDGAWRAGYLPEQIVAAIEAKQAKNEMRSWPDWRTVEPRKAIEHNRDAMPNVPEPTDARAAPEVREMSKDTLGDGSLYPWNGEELPSGWITVRVIVVGEGNESVR